MRLPLVHSQPHTVADRLAQLGLTAEQLRRAVEFGDAARRACTEFDPAWFPGMAQNACTIRSLRESLVLEGWSAVRQGGLELVVAKDGGHALTVGSGDAATGDPDPTHVPQSRYDKGASTIRAVLNNHPGQGTFSFMNRVLTAQEGVDRDTWLLLLHSTPNEVRYELSLPKTISHDDYKIVNWHERLTFPPIARDAVPPATPRADDQDDIDVDVKRRAQ